MESGHKANSELEQPSNSNGVDSSSSTRDPASLDCTSIHNEVEAVLTSSRTDLLKMIQRHADQITCLQTRLRSSIDDLSGKSQSAQLENLHRANEELSQEHLVVETFRKSLSTVPVDSKVCETASSSTALPQPLQVKRRTPLEWLWCPARMPQEQAKDVQRRASGDKGVSCSSALWQTLSTLRGVVALQCTATNLEIVEASRRAFEIWGSSSLRSSSGASLLPSLGFDEKSASWLRQEVASRIQGSTDFWLRELGCLEFRSKSGNAFDSVVIAIYLPKEQDIEASVVIIIEPMDEAPQKSSKWSEANVDFWDQHTNSSTGQYGQYRGQYDASSTASSEIGPGDSVSNVF